jgi:hypothetical protein
MSTERDSTALSSGPSREEREHRQRVQGIYSDLEQLQEQVIGCLNDVRARLINVENRCPTESASVAQPDCKGTRSDDARHDYKYVDDEYGGLAGGGDYAMYDCTKCGKRKYVELPD